MTMVELTDEELVTLREVLASHNVDPEELSAAEQVKREQERIAAYNETMRERAERCAADPEWVAGQAEARRQAELEHRKKIEELRAWSKRDVRAETAERQGRSGEASPAYRCHLCHVWMYGDAAVEWRGGLGGIYFCVECRGKRGLRCDVCGNHKDVLTNFCNDEKFRCESCADDFRRETATIPPGPVRFRL
jgi:hypothetical protein